MLAALLYGTIVAVRAGARVLASLDSDIAVAIIAAAATAFVSVLSIVLAKAYEARALVLKEHREKKTPVYEDLIKFMFRILMGAKTGKAPTEKEMLDFMSDFTQRVIVWGSDDVLAAWVKWRRTAVNAEALKTNPMTLMLLYEQLILTIRRDLGHKNQNLRTGDVLALFVNDIDQQLKGGKAS
ncbi:MAG: hypothetical protein KIT14_19080 [bacterium]|nr:hypothetical protein [bacterium]